MNLQPFLVLSLHVSTLVCLTAPYSGAPFLEDGPKAGMPSVVEDGNRPNLFRPSLLLPNAINTKGAAACIKNAKGGQIGRDDCLDTEGRECMWISLEGTDPLAPIQASTQHCLPCSIDNIEIPCWNVGALVGGMKVMDCQMKCPHQKQVSQPQYTCGDQSGFITQSQCFDKGELSGSKCMFLVYDTGGERKSSCAPCFVTGTGPIGCPQPGSEGPEGKKSRVVSCLSQCDVLCEGPPDCPPTLLPPPPPTPPAPGVVKVSLKKGEDMLSAPAPYAQPTINPHSVAKAAADAAAKTGYLVGTPLPSQTFYPVVIYRRPSGYAYTPPPL